MIRSTTLLAVVLGLAACGARWEYSSEPVPGCTETGPGLRSDVPLCTSQQGGTTCAVETDGDRCYWGCGVYMYCTYSGTGSRYNWMFLQELPDGCVKGTPIDPCTPDVVEHGACTSTDDECYVGCGVTLECEDQTPRL